MPWQVQARLDHRIIAIAYVSLLTFEILAESINAAKALAQDKQIHCFLEDYTAVTKVGAIARFSELARALLPAKPPYSRIAVLHPQQPMIRESTQYWENVRYNQGLVVRAFPEQDQAIDWLARWNLELDG